MKNEVTMGKLMSDLKTVTHDAESILQATSGRAGRKLLELRERLSSALDSARNSCARLQEKAVVGSKAADKSIRKHPYQSIGAAFGIGLLIGVVVGRRRVWGGRDPHAAKATEIARLAGSTPA